MVTSCVGMSATLLIVCGQLEALQEAVLVNTYHSLHYQMRKVNMDNPSSLCMLFCAGHCHSLTTPLCVYHVCLQWWLATGHFHKQFHFMTN